MAPVLSLDDARETRLAAMRPRRRISELCCRDGKVRVQIDALLTPDQTDAYADHLKMLARAAREGLE